MNTWTEGTKLLPIQKKPPEAQKTDTRLLTRWHLLLLINRLTGWISGATTSIQVPEDMRWVDGRSTQSEEKVMINSKPEKHRQFLVLIVFCDSASDSSVSLHCFQENLAYFLLKRSWYWHCGQVLDSTATEGHLTAQACLCVWGH